EADATQVRCEDKHKWRNFYSLSSMKIHNGQTPLKSGIIKSKVIPIVLMLLFIIFSSYSNLVVFTVPVISYRSSDFDLQVEFTREVDTGEDGVRGFVLRINDLEILFLGFNTTDIREFFKDKENYLAHNYSYMWFSPISKPHMMFNESNAVIKNISDIIIDDSAYQELVDKNVSVIFMSNYTGNTFTQKILVTNYIDIENETDWCGEFSVNDTIFVARSTIEIDNVYEIYNETTIVARNVTSIYNPSLVVYSAAKYLKDAGYQYGGVIRIFAVPTEFHPEFADECSFVWYIVFSCLTQPDNYPLETSDMYFYLILVSPQGDILSIDTQIIECIPPKNGEYPSNVILLLDNPFTWVIFGSLLSLCAVVIVIFLKRNRKNE
ncbi:MAG: hypothetical protein ACP6IS_08370, partial [Candidatus Asgardarchaeia archaeon]